MVNEPGKGVFIQFDIDGRTVFSCAVSRVESSEFDAVWATLGKRLFREAESAAKTGRAMNYGQIRMTPITD